MRPGEAPEAPERAVDEAGGAPAEERGGEGGNRRAAASGGEPDAGEAPAVHSRMRDGAGRLYSGEPSAGRRSLGRVTAHVALAIFLSTAAHLFVSFRIDLGASEAWAFLLARDGLFHAAGGPLPIRLLALVSLSGEAVFLRLPSMLIWCLVPILVAAASHRLGGRAAAIRGAWISCALPAGHAWAIIAGPAAILAVSWAGAALALTYMGKPRASYAAGRQRWAGHRRLVEGAAVGAAGLLAILSSPHGWLLPLFALPAVLLVLPKGRGSGRPAVLAAVAGPPLAGWLLVASASGRLGWAWSAIAPGGLPGSLVPHGGPLLPLLVLLLGAGPFLLVALIRWAGWALSPSKAPPRRLARALLVLGGLPALVLLAASFTHSSDALLMTAPLAATIAGLCGWKGIGDRIRAIGASSLLLIVVLGLMLTRAVPLVPEERDPFLLVHGWRDLGAAVEVWCESAPEGGAARLLAEPELAARLLAVAPACEPIGFTEGPPRLERSAPSLSGLVFVAHLSGKEPRLPKGCRLGGHAAPVGPEHLSVVLRPSRCEP